METLIHPSTLDEELTGAPTSRFNPSNFQNQSDRTDGPFANEDDDVDDQEPDETDEQDSYDEPLDEDGDPTGEHDHHQDDNYALGGHVTRSGS